MTSTPTAAEAWRLYEIANVPASGPHPPDKREIIEWECDKPILKAVEA